MSQAGLESRLVFVNRHRGPMYVWNLLGSTPRLYVTEYVLHERLEQECGWRQSFGDNRACLQVS